MKVKKKNYKIWGRVHRTANDSNWAKLGFLCQMFIYFLDCLKSVRVRLKLFRICSNLGHLDFLILKIGLKSIRLTWNEFVCEQLEFCSLTLNKQISKQLHEHQTNKYPNKHQNKKKIKQTNKYIQYSSWTRDKQIFKHPNSKFSNRNVQTNGFNEFQ